MLGHPISILLGIHFYHLNYPLEYNSNNIHFIGFGVSKVCIPCSSSLTHLQPVNAQDNCTQGTVGVSRPEGKLPGVPLLSLEAPSP